MKACFKRNRGMTLVELTIALAVIAIVSTMVVSFSLLINARREESSQRLEAMGEIELFKSTVENFLGSGSGAIVESENALARGEKRLTFADGILAEVGGNSLRFEQITDAKFRTYGTDEKDLLYLIDISYTVGGRVEIYSFCVNPYVGEAVSQ